MSKRRKFSAEFKSRVVLQLLSGEKRMAELCREHQLTSQMAGNWKQQLLTAMPQVFEENGAASDEQARCPNTLSDFYARVSPLRQLV